MSLDVLDDLLVQRTDLFFQECHVIQRQIDQPPMQRIHPVAF